MSEYGQPDVLSCARISLPVLKADEVRIKAIASPVNHTDLEIRAGNWRIRKRDPFPYVPGVEVIGDDDDVGTAVTDFRRGDRVITMMQGLGRVRAERPGGYAEYITVASAAVAPVPSALDPFDMAALGLVGVTASRACAVSDLSQGGTFSSPVRPAASGRQRHRRAAAGGVLSLVGAVAGAGVCFDAWHLLRPGVLTGYSSEDLDGAALRGAIAALSRTSS